MIRLFASLLALAALALPALATDAPSPDASVVYAPLPAHPALWTVHGAKGTAYLFGSIHILPPQVDWRTKEVEAAIAKSDAFVFELKMDDAFKARLQDYIQTRGMLPTGRHLRDMLSIEARKELDAQTAALGISPAVLDRMRPWLAALTLELASIGKQNYAANAGVDIQLQAEAAQAAKPVTGLETLDTQMALLAPSDPKVELEDFEASLKSSTGERGDEMGPLLDAWIHGDAARIARLTGQELAPYPKAKKALFDDRNRQWAKAIVRLLQAPKTYFITVGAGHLAGSDGVPALLRARGLKVEGP